MMKTQMQRTSGQTDSSNIVMYQRDFCIFLSMLGLFATRAQSDLLFAKYDVNGDGCLSLYEFLTKAKAPDYPGFDDGGEVYNERKGKRQFDDTGGKPPPRVQTPETSLFDQSRDQLHERIRERIEQKARTGVANSDNFARRKLFAAFERFDKEKCGLISLKSFSDTLEKDIGVVMGSAHVRALCKKFATDGLVDYPRLVAEIYPPTNGLQNSSVVQPRKNAGELSARKQVMPPGQNTVNVTGSYWATGTPKSLPPAPDPLSYTLEGTLSRPMSGLGSPSARVPKSSASLVSRTKASPAPTTKAAPMLRKVPVTKKVPASATLAATLSPAKASTISKVGSKAISRIGSRTMTPVH
jgi:Ca2+-binding EF-hand superfamily protein